MTAEREELIYELLEVAAELDAPARQQLLAERCAEDKSLIPEGVIDEVQSLLDASDRARAAGFLQEPLLPPEDLAAAETLRAGQYLDGYKIDSFIGAGGMGEVYLARDEELHSDVAIKLVKRGFRNGESVRRFRRERRILGQLKHANISVVHKGGETEDGTPYLVMEYVSGKPITEYADEHNLSLRERLDLFQQVSSAVSYAHQRLIVHRDIKPSNILVTEAGTPKLLDFGIAKLFDPTNSEGAYETSATLMPMMTPEYASPEQVRLDEVTTASDVYSLGVLLYELLTSQSPYRFKSRKPDEWARVVCEQEPEKPSSLIAEPGVRNANLETVHASQAARPRTAISQAALRNSKFLKGDLDNIVLMALRKEPQRRYASVSDFSEDIRRHLQGLPVKARKDTFTYRASKFVNRNKLGVAAAALILLTLIGGIIATGWQAHVARVERARAERRFDQVRTLVHTMIFDYNDAIGSLPGSTAVRKRLVGDALAYLDSLTQEAGGDHLLQLELARAYSRIGDVQGRNAAANLGDTKGAQASYSKALTILQSLVSLEPKNVDVRHDLAMSYVRMGEVNMILGNSTEALKNYRQALPLFEDLHASDPADSEFQAVLAYVHRLLGQVLGVPGVASVGDKKGALAELQKAATLYEALPVERPAANVRPFALLFDKKNDLSLIYDELADVSWAAGQHAESIEYERKAVVLMEARLAEDPLNPITRRNLAIDYANLGGSLLTSGDTQEALPLYRKSLDVEEKLASEDPNNLNARKDVAIGYRNLAKALLATGDKVAAANDYRKALATLEDLAAKDSSNNFVRRSLAITYLQMSSLLSDSGDLSEATGYASRAVSLSEQQVAVDAKNVTAKNTLAQSYSQLGKCHALVAAKALTPASEKAVLWRETRDFYQKSLTLWLEMQTQGGLSNSDAGKPGEVAREIARCDKALGK
jgi:non-specific serine/threonine protein kinase/serine/threonine-protein kinase